MKKLILSLLFVSSALQADSFEWTDVPRVVAVGDIHGAYSALVELLQGNGLINDERRWIGGDTHLVSLGDLLDRGDDTRAVMDLFRSLQNQADKAGGKVHMVLGNHEIMNLTGDWRDVTEADILSYQYETPEDALRQRRAAFYRFGTYGDWLLKRPILVKINGYVFTHGGLPQLLLEGSMQHANDSTMNLLKALVIEGEQLVQAKVREPGVNLLELAFLPSEDGEDLGLRRARNLAQSAHLGEQSPVWYRGTSLCHPLIEHDLTAAVLKKFNAKAAVVGHSPTWNHQVRRRMDGLAWAIDTGMLNSVYRGQPLALEITDDGMRVLNAKGEAVSYEDELFAGINDSSALAEVRAMTNASATIAAQQPVSEEQPRRYRKDRLVDLQDASGAAIGQAWFRPLGKKAVKKELAAFQLDRLLGIGMVPPTVAASVDGDSGIMQWTNSTIVTEQARQQQQLAFPNWCDRGSSYQVVSAFDALIDQRDRSVWNLAYEQRLTRIRLIDHGDTFTNGRKVQDSESSRVLSETLRKRLATLSTDSLTPLLSELLTKREIAALLKRRDAILQWPRLPKR